MQKSCNKNQIVKLGSFSHNSFEYRAHRSYLCPWAIIPIIVIGNCSSPNIILLHTCSLGKVVFAWSILSWIMFKNSSFYQTNFVFHIWCKFLHGGHVIYRINSNPCFHTSTLRWRFFFNLFITNWKIPLMFNSLLTCDNTNSSINKTRLQEKICQNNRTSLNMWSFLIHYQSKWQSINPITWSFRSLRLIRFK